MPERDIYRDGGRGGGGWGRVCRGGRQHRRDVRKGIVREGWVNNDCLTILSKQCWMAQREILTGSGKNHAVHCSSTRIASAVADAAAIGFDAPRSRPSVGSTGSVLVPPSAVAAFVDVVAMVAASGPCVVCLGTLPPNRACVVLPNRCAVGLRRNPGIAGRACVA